MPRAFIALVIVIVNAFCLYGMAIVTVNCSSSYNLSNK